jgi:hypothetical protein
MTETPRLLSYYWPLSAWVAARSIDSPPTSSQKLAISGPSHVLHQQHYHDADCTVLYMPYVAYNKLIGAAAYGFPS